MSDADEAVDAEKPAREVVRVDGPGGTDADAGDDGEGDGGSDRPPVGREGVVDPDDLDISGRDAVDETDDGRYVISTAGGRDAAAGSDRGSAGDEAGDEGVGGEAGGTGTPDGEPLVGPVPVDSGTPDRVAAAVADAENGDAETGESEAEDGRRVDDGDGRRGEGGVASASEGGVAGDGEDADPLGAAAAELAALSAPHGVALAAAVDGEADTLRVAGDDPAATLAPALRWYATRVAPDEPPDETVARLLAASDLRLGLDGGEDCD